MLTDDFDENRIEKGIFLQNDCVMKYLKQ